MTSFDLHRPIERDPAGSPPLVMCTASYFAEWTRSAEIGAYEGLDAFASYAVFARTTRGEVECVRVDDQFGARIDRVM